MFILAQLIRSIAHLISILCHIYYILLLIRIIISWVSPASFHPAVKFLYQVTEPILRPIRRIIPNIGMIDISPIIAFIAIYFIQDFVVNVLIQISGRL
jgi:YggT family protein